jgi:nicotinic acid mononucleotide adenylyltransferase
MKRNVGLSSTFIRDEVANGKSIKYYVPENIETSVELEYGP